MNMIKCAFRFLLMLPVAFVMLAVGACVRFDDAPIWDKLKEHEERIAELERQCERLNGNVQALQTVLEAVQQNDYVTDVVKVVEAGVEIGYCLTFAKGGTVTVYHGINGEDGDAPKIGIRKAADGEYYWTADGEWMTGEDGEKIPAAVQDDTDGKYITPRFRVAEGIWYISYDNGNSWRVLDETAWLGGGVIFKDVTYDETTVCLTLADGSVICVPRQPDDAVTLNLIEVAESSAVFHGKVNSRTPDLKVSVYCSTDQNLTVYDYDVMVSVTAFPEDSFELGVEGLAPDTRYYYFIEIVTNGQNSYSKVASFRTCVMATYVGKTLHFSCDDTYACLYDLIQNGDSYESVFENSFFAALKTCHEETGACFTLMTFNRQTTVPDYDISNVPSKFRVEFQDNKSWLRFAFHAEDETTRYATATGAAESYAKFVNAIYTLTGDYGCIDNIARLGFFNCNLTNALIFKNADHGITGLLSADDTRVSYYLTYEQSETARLRGQYYDMENDLFFIKTLNRSYAKAQSELDSNPDWKHAEFFWHEYERPTTIPSWITTCAALYSGKGYSHCFPEDVMQFEDLTEVPEEKLMSVKFEDGCKMTIRCKDWTEDEDFVWVFNGVGGSNRTANLQNCGTIAKDVYDASLTYGMAKTVYKSCADDTAPISFNGSYFAGNHAMTGATTIKVASHDLTTEDIGSTWTDSDPENPCQYMLARVDNATKLTFINLAQQVTSGNGPFNYSKHLPVSPLVHVKNATNTSDIEITGYTNSEQLWPGSNHVTNRYFVDDVEIHQNGLYKGNKVYNICTYDVIYVPAILEYLENNVGKNTNASHGSDEITDKYISIELIQEFRPNGSQTTYCKYTLDQRSSLKFSYIYAAQCAAFSKPVYFYIPGAYQDEVFLHDGSATLQFRPDTWNDATQPPYRYFMLSSDKTKGFQLAYSRDTELGDPANRVRHLTSAGWSPSSCKLYPIWTSGTFAAGSSFESVTGRIPLNMSLNNGTTAIGWYWEYDDIIMTIDSHSPCSGIDIPLPGYMRNRKVEVLDKTASVTFDSEDTTGNSLHYAAESGSGYLVLRLSDVM